MKNLSETWMVDGTIDFELKKYTLLAYLQTVNSYFDQNKIFPQLPDLIFHYNQLVAFRENKDFFRQEFQKKLSDSQIKNLETLYEEIITDKQLMNEIEEIMYFATFKMRNAISSGKEIYDFVEHNISITPVGLKYTKNNEGYFFLSNGHSSSTKVFSYHLTISEQNNQKFHTLTSTFITEWKRNTVNTFENIKVNLLKFQCSIPNPAVYSIETALDFPLEETLLPIAKRILVKYINVN